MEKLDSPETEVEDEYNEIEIIKTDDVKRRMNELDEEIHTTKMESLQMYENQINIERSSEDIHKRRRTNSFESAYVYDSHHSSEQNLPHNVEPADEFTIFGQFVANELRAISNPVNRKKLKLVIQRAIIDITETDD